MLLSRTRQTGDLDFGDDAEPAEEFDTERWSTSHAARLHRFERAVDFVGGRLKQWVALLNRAMRERLFDPGRCEEFCHSFTEEMTRLRRDHLAGQAGQRRELAAVARRQREIIDAIVEGYRSEAWKAELLVLDAKKEQLDAALRAPELPALHPNMAQVYRDKATALAVGLEREDERDGASQALRGHRADCGSARRAAAGCRESGSDAGGRARAVAFDRRGVR